MKILNFGSCNIDYVYSLDHIVVPGETLTATKMEKFPGGKGLNQSVAAARAGGQVYHAGVIGTDGGMLRQILADSGADVRYLQNADCPNGHAIIQLSSTAQNSIFLHVGTNGMVTKEYIDRVLEDFSAGDILVLQNEISNVPYLIDRGYEKGLRILFNPAPFDATLPQLPLHKLDYLILNEVEAKGFFGEEDPVRILARKRQLYPTLKMVLTLGKEGCIYADGERMIRCPAYRVEAVDTTAAGDTFAGYLAAGLAEGMEIGEVLRRASAASALAVSGMGAAPSIPLREAVEQAIKHLKLYASDTDRQGKLQKQIIGYIHQDIFGADLSGLAKTLGYTHAYTGTLVKEVTGRCFGKLLQELRCQAAARLLRQTDLPVSAVIQSVGYQNESFFRKKFQGIYGVSPLQYRKENQGGNRHDR